MPQVPLPELLHLTLHRALSTGVSACQPGRGRMLVLMITEVALGIGCGALAWAGCCCHRPGPFRSVLNLSGQPGRVLHASPTSLYIISITLIATTVTALPCAWGPPRRWLAPKEGLSLRPAPPPVRGT
jgi:hypothetical protein